MDSAIQEGPINSGPRKVDTQHGNSSGSWDKHSQCHPGKSSLTTCKTHDTTSDRSSLKLVSPTITSPVPPFPPSPRSKDVLKLQEVNAKVSTVFGKVDPTNVVFPPSNIGTNSMPAPQMHGTISAPTTPSAAQQHSRSGDRGQSVFSSINGGRPNNFAGSEGRSSDKKRAQTLVKTVQSVDGQLGRFTLQNIPPVSTARGTLRRADSDTPAEIASLNRQLSKATKRGVSPGLSSQALETGHSPTVVRTSSASRVPQKAWESLVENIRHTGVVRTSVDQETVFDSDDPQIKEDIIRMIVQYLQDEGYTISSTTIQDETNVKLHEQNHRRSQIEKMRKCIKEGDWETAAKLTTKQLKKHSQKGFLYMIFRQEYLELIDRQEYQKAFTFLTTRLKSMESIARSWGKNEFADLCYLLTSKSVNDAETFRDWPGVVAAREAMADNFQHILDIETSVASTHVKLPGRRLITLLQQAVAYQMEFSRYHPETVPKALTLLRDYECAVLPNSTKSIFTGHTANIKCVHFVGKEGLLLATGSSDNTVKIWASDNGNAEAFADSAGVEYEDIFASLLDKDDGDDQGSLYDSDLDLAELSNMDGMALPSTLDSDFYKPRGSWQYTASSRFAQPTPTPAHHSTAVRTLVGHNSRIWQICSSKNGKFLYSASGDGLVKVWDLHAPDSDVCRGSWECHAGDAYSISLHSGERHIVTGGYDRTLRVTDVATGTIVKKFAGHNAAVSSCIFNPYGNLIVSGSKDNTIRFWDVISGLCVRTLHQTLGEVTSIEMNSNGLLLLTGSRNNSNRLWDIRMTGSRDDKPLQRFKGHQNTSKNFIRASFGPRESLVLGGSEDGMVYVWDVDSSKLLQRLRGHRQTVYGCQWNARQSLFASCAEDGTARTWWWDENATFEFEKGF